MVDAPRDPEPSPSELVDAVREGTRFEIRLLHDRVNALLAAEAFLTIAYTAAMGSSGRWAAVVAPALAVLGLLLAVVAWPGVSATSRLVLAGTVRLGDLLERHPQVRPAWSGGQEDRGRRELDQRRSLLFFRSAPAMLVGTWVVLLACSLLLRS